MTKQERIDWHLAGIIKRLGTYPSLSQADIKKTLEESTASNEQKVNGVTKSIDEAFARILRLKELLERGPREVEDGKGH